jgi:hypothetical protein
VRRALSRWHTLVIHSGSSPPAWAYCRRLSRNLLRTVYPPADIEMGSENFVAPVLYRWVARPRIGSARFGGGRGSDLVEGNGGRSHGPISDKEVPLKTRNSVDRDAIRLFIRVRKSERAIVYFCMGSRVRLNLSPIRLNGGLESRRPRHNPSSRNHTPQAADGRSCALHHRHRQYKLSENRRPRFTLAKAENAPKLPTSDWH